MNLTLVLAFHKVATAGSFTHAARMSGVSQPTLSGQVRQLEKSIGKRLFERTGRRVRLTPAGEALFVATGRLAEAIGTIERVLEGNYGERSGVLRVSADSAVHVLPVLGHMKKAAGELSFSLRIDNSSEVTAQVLNEEVDVGVMARATADARLSSAKIRQDRLVLLVSRRDPLAARKRLKLADFAGRDLVVRERGSITREVMEQQLEAAGIRTGQVFDVATREAVREAVAAGFGAGVVFASEAGNDPRLTTLAIQGADLTVAEYAICRAERRRVPLIAQFFDAAARMAAMHRWL
ncbi:MAG: LysR substrate-binding domain-containing protein [Hyphomicrobiaceae bacterium]